MAKRKATTAAIPPETAAPDASSRATPATRPEDLRFELRHPDTLPDNEMNWRKHGEAQLTLLRELLDRAGWAGAALYNERTGRLIDGHARKALALSRGEMVPTLIGSWDEDQEKQLLLELDPVGAMAMVNQAKLNALRSDLKKRLDSLEGVQKEGLARSIAAVAIAQRNTVAGNKKLEAAFGETSAPGPSYRPFSHVIPPEGVQETRLVDGQLFEPGQPYDIPAMRSDRLSALAEPIAVWGGEMSPECAHYLCIQGVSANRFVDKSRSWLTFNTADEAFERVWSHAALFAEQLLKDGWAGVAAPDFTLTPQEPKAMRIWETYRRFWVARYWQECGLNVLPQVLIPDHESDLEFFFCGVPAGAPQVMVQVQNTGGLGDLAETYQRIKWGLHQVVNLLRPESLAVYGGETMPDFLEYACLPSALHVVCIGSYNKLRRAWLEARSAARKE